MKKISIVVPTYNEEENVEAMAAALTELFDGELSSYDREIIFIDNCSKDNTREKLEKICRGDKRIRAIFNAKNFGQFNSPYSVFCRQRATAPFFWGRIFGIPLR